MLLSFCLAMLACNNRVIVKKKEIKSISFTSYTAFTDEGEKNLRDFWLQMAEEGPGLCDSSAYERLVSFDIVKSFQEEIDTLVIQLYSDSITMQSSGVTLVNYRDQYIRYIGKRKNLRKIDTISKGVGNLSYSIDKKKRKHIMGYDCYQVQFSVKENPDEILPMGDVHYTMWVTDEINIPIQFFLPEFPRVDFFPLYVSHYFGYTKGMDNVTKVISVDP